MENPVIALRDVYVSLGEGEARTDILHGISLQIYEGQSVSLVGPSGSGKSTTLMIMAGLEQINSGFVHIAGQDLGVLSEDDLAEFRGRKIGIIFQSFHLIPTMTALENVAIPLDLAGEPNAFERAKAELEAVGLGHRLHHHPSSMSGGEQQRVAIARALVTRPEVLIADEPTGNLDSQTGSMIMQLLFDLQRKRNTILVLVTHDETLASKCDIQLHMKDGRLAENQKSTSTPVLVEA